MNQPNMRGGGFRQAQQPSPLAIRTKKYQFDPNTYTRIAMAEVWRKEWWRALIPFAVGVLPAIIWPSWWWLALGVLLAAVFVLVRSSLVTGVTQMEQSKPLFETRSWLCRGSRLAACAATPMPTCSTSSSRSRRPS